MKRSILATLLLPIVISGCTPEPRNSIETRATPTTAEVQTTVVAYQPLQKQVTMVGQINPTEHGRADITTPLQGIVIQPLVTVGLHVGQGSPIAEINNVYGQTRMQLRQKIDADLATSVSAQNALQQAIATLGQARATLAQSKTTLSQAVDNLVQSQAELANATTDYHRKQTLKNVGVSAQADVDDSHERYRKATAVVADMTVELRTARDGVAISQANILPDQQNVQLCRDNVALARRQVDHDQVISQGALNPVGSDQTQFYVRAPISGTVTAVNMSAGLAVSPGTILATVVDTHNVYVDANAYASDLQGVHRGDPIEVHADGFPNEHFSGRVSYIGKQMDATSRTVPVRCLIPNRHDALRPGLFVQAVLTQPVARQALTVPNRAVLLEGHQHYVVVESKDGQFDKRPIQEGVRTESVTEVLSGLKVGDRVVTEGNLLVIPQ